MFMHMRHLNPAARAQRMTRQRAQHDQALTAVLAPLKAPRNVHECPENDEIGIADALA